MNMNTTIFQRVVASDAGWAPLALRVPAGIIFAAHGAQKLFGWFGGYGIEGTAGFFEGFGFESRPFGSLPEAIRDSRALAGTEIAAKEPLVLELPKRWPAV